MADSVHAFSVLRSNRFRDSHERIATILVSADLHRADLLDIWDVLARAQKDEVGSEVGEAWVVGGVYIDCE